MNIQDIFKIKDHTEFDAMALKVFEFQYANNAIYRDFCLHLGKNVASVKQIADIPFLPIEFFKTKKIVSTAKTPQTVFASSGTTGSKTSKHYVISLKAYEQSFRQGFETFYGPIENYCVLALLPSYLERDDSSLVYMVNDLIQKSGHPDSGFYLNEFSDLQNKIVELEASQTKTILIGVSFALLEFAARHKSQLRHTIVMETGGMKGRRKEMIRSELHQTLSKAFSVESIHSEYGMTELLSQAYSMGKGIYKAPPWMRILVRDTEDPLSFQPTGKTGGLNIIDLANLYSCSFIATQDLGKINADQSFEILGRFDNSDIRGCNLMVIES